MWKEGDEYMGDPPMEEQGLNTIFNSDKSTWALIDSISNKANPGSAFGIFSPAKQTVYTSSKITFKNVVAKDQLHK